MPGEAPASGVIDVPMPGPAARRSGLLGLLAGLAPLVATAQGTDVDPSDLYLRGGRLASGAWSCGFAILANHRTRDDPHVEWDISVDQVNNGHRIVFDVSASSFVVARKLRTVRAPVSALTFVVDQDPQPIHLQFADPADAQGTVHGELASAEAARLFAAVAAGSFVTMVLDFPEQQPESLRFHLARDSARPAQDAFAELCRPVAAKAP